MYPSLTCCVTMKEPTRNNLYTMAEPSGVAKPGPFSRISLFAYLTLQPQAFLAYSMAQSSDPWPALGQAPQLCLFIHSPFAASVRLGRSNVSKFRSISASFFPGTERWYALRGRESPGQTSVCQELGTAFSCSEPKGDTKTPWQRCTVLRGGVRLAQDSGGSGVSEQPNHVLST